MRMRDGLVEIDGQIITTRNLADSVVAIVRRLGEMKSFLVCTLNLDHLVKLRADSRFRDAYAKAEIVMPDGFPIVAFARMEGVSLERATGSDLILPLCHEAASRGYPVYLFGSTFETLCVAGRNLSAMIPGLQIAGVTAPPLNFDVTSTISDAPSPSSDNPARAFAS